MNLATATAKAETVRGDKSAARLYNSIEHELGLTDNEDSYDDGEKALGVLRERFPGVEDEARQVTEPPSLSRGASGRLSRPALSLVGQEEHRRQRPQGIGQRARHASQIHARGARGRRVSAGGARRGRGPAGRRWQQTGIPGAYESGVQLLMRTIGGIVGLSALYLILTPDGSRALSLTSSGLVHALEALVLPNVDPLRATAADIRAAKSGRPDPRLKGVKGGTKVPKGDPRIRGLSGNLNTTLPPLRLPAMTLPKYAPAPRGFTG